MRTFLLAASLLFVVALGCQKSSGGVKVSGRVTRDGQPLSKAQIVFQSLDADGKPDANKEAGGETDENGQYSLKRIKQDGVVPGDYRVEIHLIERSQKGIRDLIPSQYNTSSKLKFTVPPGGTNEANFDLKSS